MRILAFAAAIAGLACAVPSAGARAQAPGVFRLPEPPAGFKPVEATDSDLAKYGLPPRPNPMIRGGVPYATWVKAMSAARNFVAPELRLTGRRHRSTVRLARGAFSRLGGVDASYNWSGQALTNGATSFGSQSFAEVLSQWVVTAVQQAIGTCNPVDVSAIWVGLDGFSNDDVVQAGTESDVYCSNGNEQADYYAWFEWAPADEVALGNFPIYPGAPMFVVVTGDTPTSATATFVNLQSNQYTTVGFYAPSGTSLVGSSAEWIVERPQIGNAPVTASNLTDYGMIWMSSEIAFPFGYNNDPANYDTPGAPGAGHAAYTITMVDSNGNPLAKSNPQGNAAQDVDVLGSAY